MNVTALITGRKPVPGKPDFSFLILNNGKTLVDKTSTSAGQSAVTYAEHKKGDTFVATKNSKVNGEDGNPLYLEGETVTRLKDSTEILGYTTVEVWKALN